MVAAGASRQGFAWFQDQYRGGRRKELIVLDAEPGRDLTFDLRMARAIDQ